MTTKFLLQCGGSPMGMSYWSSVLPCPRAHWFRYREHEYVPRWGKPGTDKPEPLMTGTLVHAHLEILAEGVAENRPEFIDALTGEPLAGFGLEVAEARRIFEQYFKLVGFDEGVSDWQLESLLEDKSGDLGVPWITSRVDGAASWAGGILNQSNGLYLNPGRYLWEHKTASKKSEHLFQEHRVQVQVNCELWNKQHPDQKVLGGILNNIIKTKEVKVERIFIPLMDDVARENITKSLRFVYEIHEKFGDQMVATKNTCTGDWSPCAYYERCWS